MGRQVALESPASRQDAGTQVDCISGNCCDPSTWPAKWDMDCLRCIYCPDDAAVLARASQLRVFVYDSIIFEDYLFKDGAWTVVDVPAGGSQGDGEITMEGLVDCHSAALTLYHEVRHSNQSAGMTTYDAEVDAYTTAEQWSISKGLRDVLSLRRTDEFGNLVPDGDAIHATVMEYYFNAPPGGEPPTEQAVGIIETPPQTVWQNVATGAQSTRPAQENDYVQTNTVRYVGPGLMDPSEFSCGG